MASSKVKIDTEGGKVYFDPTTGMITGADKTVTSVVIPATIEGVPVTSINQWAFYENPVLKSVTIPNTVTTIGKGAFYGYTALESIVIPESVTELSEMMLYHCTGLKRAYLPNSLTKINRLAFYECTSLEYITIPQNVELICEMAFYDCSSLKGVAFKSNNTVLEKTIRGDRELNFVFWHCLTIEKVVNCPDPEWSQRMLQNRWEYDYMSNQNPSDYIVDEGEDAVIYRDIAQSVTAGCTTDMEKARAITNWVIQHVDYDAEFARTKQNRPDIYRDSKTLISGILADETKQVTTTCGGYTNVTLSLLWSIGIPATGIWREQKPGERIDHEYGIAYLDGRWAWFDTTQSDHDDSESEDEAERRASLNGPDPDYLDAKSCGLGFNFDHRSDYIQSPTGKFEPIPEDISMPEMVQDWDDSVAATGDGFYKSSDGEWVLFINGAPDYGYNDLYCDPEVGWWLVKNGKVDFEYNGLYGSANFGWWKIAGGAVDFGFTDLFCSPQYGWWLVNGGSVAFWYNDLFGSPNYGWWKVSGGAVDFGFTDLYYSPS